MKRMKEISIACIALMLLLTAVTIPYTSAKDGTCELIADLIAGGGAGSGEPKSAIDVGDVYVGVCGDTLYVTYVITKEGWCLTETHLHVGEYEHVGDDFTVNIPQTKKGNPIPGKFDYKNEHDCVTKYTYPIDLNDWEEGDKLVIAAHAVVRNLCGCGCETAWGAGFGCLGNGFDFPGKNWATGFTYTVQDDM